MAGILSHLPSGNKSGTVPPQHFPGRWHREQQPEGRAIPALSLRQSPFSMNWKGISMRVVLSLVSLTLMSGIWAALPQTPKPQPIGSGFDFPGDQTKLLKLRDANDFTGMRLHAWMVFAGMTQPTSGGEAV